MSSLFERYRGVLLFVLPLPLAFRAMASLWQGDLPTFAVAGGCYALFLVAALINRAAFATGASYHARHRARSRPIPRKAIAGITVGIATGLTAHLLVGRELPLSAVFGIAAAGAFFLSYGFDARPKPVEPSAHGVAEDELQTALSEAYAKLDRINAARQGIRSTEFQQRLAAIVDGTRKILEVIEQDPRDLRRARKFLNVYLGGIESVTEQYARTHADSPNADLEQRYRTLLVDMQNACVEQREKLMQNDYLDLDVRIEVLSDRLKKEGVL